MADKKPTHVAVNSIQYHREGAAVEVKPGDEFVGSDVGDAKELERLVGTGAIKTIKAAAKEESEADKAAAAAAQKAADEKAAAEAAAAAAARGGRS